MNAASETSGIILLTIFPFFQIIAYEILRRKKLIVAIRKRNRNMIGFGTLAGWMSYLNLLFAVSTIPLDRASKGTTHDTREGWFYCGLYHTLNLLIPPLSIGPQLVRGINLWSMMKRTKLMLKHGETTKLRRNRFGVTAAAAAVVTTITPGANTEATLQRMEEASDHHSENIPSSNSEEGGVRDNDNPREMAFRIKRKTKTWVRFTIGIISITYIILIGIYAGITDDDQFRTTSYNTCYPEPGEYSYIFAIGIVIAIIICILTFFTTVLVHNSNDDELGIRQEITRNVIFLFGSNVVILILRYLLDNYYVWQSVLFCAQQLCLTCSMIILPCLSLDGDFIHVLPENDVSSSNENQLSSSINERKDSSGQIVHHSFCVTPKDQAVHKPINRRLSVLAIVNRRQSQLNAKKEAMEKATSLDAGLRSLLSTTEGIDVFTEHCSREFSVENIRFWCICNEFHRAIDLLRTPSCQDESDYGECDIRVFAQDIYDSYIKVGADLQINISAIQRKSIQMSLECASQQVVYRLKRDLFDKAQLEIFKMMSGHSYPRFLASKQNDNFKRAIKTSK